eukprot:TRINITY_DN1410_c0_g1_i1.p1 TRINITY_DN1410_c0_g1~~TRINITY_DN1410_c0_g1_i1.p1  ORF type:complete len:425 (-),score=39.37 TRINITY_DN1410_c0_g1_i1:53-1327(-)
MGKQKTRPASNASATPKPTKPLHVGGLPLYCWFGIGVLAFLIYTEYTIRRAWVHTLTTDAVVEYLKRVFAVPTPFQLSLFPAYVAFLFIGTKLIPGYYILGSPLADNRRIKFRLNGLRLFFVLLLTGAIGHYTGVIPATIVYDNFYSLLLTVNAWAVVVSVYLYVVGKMHGEGKNKSFFDNFVMGTELMPFVGGEPLKMFWLKPSMMGWGVINLSLLAKHYELLGHISMPMALYQGFSMLYIIDYFYHEERMTSTWDIIAEHFGLMLVWGDIVFIPFVFSIQAWFLVTDNTYLEFWQIFMISGVFFMGYAIFRGCNSQKHDFKHNPKAIIWGKPAQTVGGGRLLVSGWWGIARHINYTGDILLGLGFSLPCGFRSVLPYTYPIYLTLLLVHREVRDNNRCADKYKEVWNQYCARVPYRMVPYIY